MTSNYNFQNYYKYFFTIVFTILISLQASTAQGETNFAHEEKQFSNSHTNKFTAEVTIHEEADLWCREFSEEIGSRFRGVKCDPLRWDRHNLRWTTKCKCYYGDSTSTNDPVVTTSQHTTQNFTDNIYSATNN